MNAGNMCTISQLVTSTHGFLDLLLDLKYKYWETRSTSTVEMSSSCENEIDIVMRVVGYATT